jgi:hypothetical protein
VLFPNHQLVSHIQEPAADLVRNDMLVGRG